MSIKKLLFKLPLCHATALHENIYFELAPYWHPRMFLIILASSCSDYSVEFVFFNFEVATLVAVNTYLVTTGFKYKTGMLVFLYLIFLGIR